MTTVTLTQPLARSRWAAVVAASIGNALEWFDFAVFGFFALTVSKLFFPASNETLSLLFTYATLGITFIVRPIGAMVIGAYADRHGRKAALILTIGLMMLGTAIVAIVPTYASIGVLAPLVIVAARMIQGFSAGGEFGSATAFLAEQNPQRRGFFASWQLASQGLTTVLATGFGVVHFAAGLLYGVIQIALIPIFGSLSDRIGRSPVPAVCAVAMLLVVYPMFAWLASAPTLQTLLWVWVIFGVLIAGYHGSIPALMSELFPTRTRTTGLSISYAFGVMFFGGFAPYILTWLIEVTGSKLAPSFYLMFAAGISIIALAGARGAGYR